MAERSTRQLVLAYLQTHPRANSTVLARELGLSTAAIRYHLKRLNDDGLITRIDDTQGQRPKGRPHKPASLAGSQTPNNLTALVQPLLQLLQNHLTTDQLALFLAEHLVPDHNIPKALSASLPAAIQWLNEHAYAARWEAHRNGPRIIFARCPYAEAWHGFPAFCLVDSLILQHLTGRRASVLQTIFAHGKAKTVSCVFQIE